MRGRPVVLLVAVVLSRVGGEAGDWISWSLSQAKEASMEASSALYRGVRELACLQVGQATLLRY